jgi:hypothetical protein
VSAVLWHTEAFTPGSALEPKRCNTLTPAGCGFLGYACVNTLHPACPAASFSHLTALAKPLAKVNATLSPASAPENAPSSVPAGTATHSVATICVATERSLYRRCYYLPLQRAAVTRGEWRQHRHPLLLRLLRPGNFFPN